MPESSGQQWVIDMHFLQYFFSDDSHKAGHLAQIHHEILFNDSAFTGIPVYRHTLGRIIEDYLFEDRVFVFRRSGYARRGGQSPPYGKSFFSHDLCKAQ
jgi:hypothetical protein